MILTDMTNVRTYSRNGTLRTLSQFEIQAAKLFIINFYNVHVQ